MNKPGKRYWSWREEQFHDAIKEWLRQAYKDFDEEDDIGTFAQLLSTEEQAALAECLGMTLKELKECLVHGGLYPDKEQAKRWKRYDMKKKEVCVLIGNSEDAISDCFSLIIKEVIGDRYNVKVTSVSHADEILKLAQEHPFDIFILVLNNIIFPSCNLPPEKRLKKSLELLGHLKAAYSRPAIALYGYPDDPSFADRARMAGARFVFRLPFDSNDFGQAIKECLGMTAR